MLPQLILRELKDLTSPQVFEQPGFDVNLQSFAMFEFCRILWVCPAVLVLSVQCVFEEWLTNYQGNNTEKKWQTNEK